VPTPQAISTKATRREAIGIKKTERAECSVVAVIRRASVLQHDPPYDLSGPQLGARYFSSIRGANNSGAQSERAQQTPTCRCKEQLKQRLQ